MVGILALRDDTLEPKAAGMVERRDRLDPSAPKSEALLARHRGTRPGPNGAQSAASP